MYKDLSLYTALCAVDNLLCSLSSLPYRSIWPGQVLLACILHALSWLELNFLLRQILRLYIFQGERKGHEKHRKVLSSMVVTGVNMGTKRGRPSYTHAERRRDEAEIEIVPRQRTGRKWTMSIALPSSILQNAQTSELQMYLAGQVARAAAIFSVDEVVIFSEPEDQSANQRNYSKRNKSSIEPTSFFKTVLEYLETPQYLRKHLFPMSSDLRLVGILNPLALPSHLGKFEYSRWREGVAVNRNGFTHQSSRIQSSERDQKMQSVISTRFIDVGQERLAEVEKPLEIGTRVTIDLEKSGTNYEACPGKYLYGDVSTKTAPLQTEGIYWGYTVREASSLAEVFSNSAVCSSYDLVLGTSERGTPLSSMDHDEVEFALPEFSHVLLVFGGLQGLEYSARCDPGLVELGITEDGEEGSRTTSGTGKTYGVCDLFDFYINTCPFQGSRTIRTEEAILISLAALKPYLRPKE